MAWWYKLDDYWELVAPLLAMLVTGLGPALSVLTIGWVLSSKKNSTSALAWCLLVLLLPVMGPLIYVVFGYQHVEYPLTRRRRHRYQFQVRHPFRAEAPTNPAESVAGTSSPSLERLALRVGATPLLFGNHLQLYHEPSEAYKAMLEAMRSARHHLHLEYFIFQPDESGREFLNVLEEKARAGVQIRLLYDAMGSHRLHRATLRSLAAAGGRSSLFLPIKLLRRRFQINLRNHRKILVVDGQVAFSGGLNIGDEYLGRDPRFGPWRDTHLRVEGSAVAALQRIFLQDWDFAAAEDLAGADYYPQLRSDGPCAMQIVESGPDHELKAIREVYFAAILEARERLWIASPYFVPDPGLLDALCLACFRGVDVRLLCLFHPDKWVPFLAGRYYWTDVLEAGGRIYQYTRGMMHSKVILVDGQWASVGTANFDNRSMHLNFEVNCLIHSPQATRELEEAFLRDLDQAICVERAAFAQRPLSVRLLENGSRLFSPIL